MKKTSVFCLFCLLVVAIPTPADCQPLTRRGLFVSVIQESPVFLSRRQITELIHFAKQARMNVLFVQVYRENKAWFYSRHADAGPYEQCLKNISEDPFALLIKQAHAEGIRVHAWLNLLSLSQNEDTRLLKKYGTGILTKNLKNKKTLRDYRIDDQYYLEPSDGRVRGELSMIVEEILRAYPELDGVQFDYIRYPDKQPFYGYSRINTERFKKVTGRRRIDEQDPAWKDWKRAQVTGLLELLVRKTRAIRRDIQISVTGCMPFSRAYHEAYQDWIRWLEKGLVDFVTVMSYSPDPAEFERYLADIKGRVPDFKKVYVGVGAYKLRQTPERFAREFAFCETTDCGACVVFHYGSLLENPALKAPLLEDEK